MNKQTQEALKMAIEDLEDANSYLSSEWSKQNHYGKAIQACKEALAQPAQEPVAFTNADEIQELKDGMTTCYMYKKRLNADCISLYTHPAPSWQGLSIEEVDSIMQKVFSESDIESAGTKTCSVFECYLAIEAALKEKNA